MANIVHNNSVIIYLSGIYFHLVAFALEFPVYIAKLFRVFLSFQMISSIPREIGELFGFLTQTDLV